MTYEIKNRMTMHHVYQQMEKILASYMPRGVGQWHLQWISETSCELSFEIRSLLPEKFDVSESIPLRMKWLVAFEGKVHGRMVRVTTRIERP